MFKITKIKIRQQRKRLKIIKVKRQKIIKKKFNFDGKTNSIFFEVGLSFNEFL